jgi:hypothetical protein
MVYVCQNKLFVYNIKKPINYPLPGMVNGGPMMAMAGGAMPHPIAPMVPPSASWMKNSGEI